MAWGSTVAWMLKHERTPEPFVEREIGEEVVEEIHLRLLGSATRMAVRGGIARSTGDGQPSLAQVDETPLPMVRQWHRVLALSQTSIRRWWTLRIFPTPTAELSLKDLDPAMKAVLPPDPTLHPLKGLKIVIIHVKDNFSDGESTGEIILSELLEYEREVQLGCEFVISKSGQSFKF